MNIVFVFGSNLAGRHGAGAAKYAVEHYGAEYGIGFGRTGNAYAIPTKDSNLRTLSLDTIEHYIKNFVQYAHTCGDTKFLLTPIGCGLAGYRRDQIRPLIEKYDPPDNVILTKEWNDPDVN